MYSGHHCDQFDLVFLFGLNSVEETRCQNIDNISKKSWYGKKKKKPRYILTLGRQPTNALLSAKVLTRLLFDLNFKFWFKFWILNPEDSAVQPSSQQKCWPDYFIISILNLNLSFESLILKTLLSAKVLTRLLALRPARPFHFALSHLCHQNTPDEVREILLMKREKYSWWSERNASDFNLI